ncbi:MAG: FKBP-type peptidyl-prolyl cis-trans isomerase [Armatimonadota bacterium]
MAQAKSGDTVKVHYTGTLEDGSVFDSSESREPLEFTIGSGEVIPGFEEGVTGMAPGDTKTINIPADQAYGPEREELTTTVPRDQFPPDIEPEVGMQLQLRLPNGQPIPVRVCAVTDNEVSLDANHPLAGKDLTFKLDLVDIYPEAQQQVG